MKKFLAISSLFLIFAGFSFLYPLNIAENLEQKLTFYDRNGEILYTEKPYFFTGTWKNKFLEKAIISLEDKEFYKHSGVNFKSLLRAGSQNFSAKKTVSGASTITMQLAKLSFLSNEKHNYWYKIRQIWYALKLDFQLGKDEILAKYLEKINFGNGATGISAASQKYFNKNPANLSIGETITLLAIIQNPAKFNPLQNPDKNAERRNFILQRLKSREILSQADYDFWRIEKVELTPQKIAGITAPHFIFWVRSYLKKLNLTAPELHIHTTLDKKLYEKSLKISREILAKNGRDKNISNSAVVILDTENKVRVILGSPNYFDKKIAGAVNMATSPRQTGSVLKPFLYALALDLGMSPLSELRDEKTIFPSGYFPRNFNILEENGSVRFREALANSYNIAAVDLLNQIGVEKFYNFCQNKLGLNFAESASELGLSLILGSGSSSLLNLTQAFSIFTHQGSLQETQFLEKITDGNHDILWENLAKKNLSSQALKTDSAEWGQHVLSDNQARWKNFSRGNSLELNFPSGSKTGTSQGFKDNWVLGFSRDFTVGVWVGNANGSAMHASSGMQGAGPIWQRIMQMVNQNPAKKFKYSGNRREKTVCRRPGKKKCQEKVTAFVLDNETSRNSVEIQTEKEFNKLKIVYPQNNDVFMKNSDLLIKIRDNLEGEVSYFLNNKKLDSVIIKNLPSGKNVIRVESRNQKDEINIEVK